MNKMNDEARKQNILAIIIVVLAVPLVALVLFFALSQDPAPQRNADTYCIDEEGGIGKIHVVLLDVSEELTELHEQALRHRIDFLWESIGPEERIDLYITQHAGTAMARPISSFCNPSRSGNDWTEGSKIRESRYREMWNELERTFEDARKNLGRDESPIIEALLAIGTTSLAEARQLGIPASLTIVSDMLQNSTTLNQYKEQPTYEKFRERVEYERVRPDLGGAEVAILYLQRPGRESVQGGRHATFWASLIGDAGATFGAPAVEKIRGGAR